jgi:hypothetical protein
VGQSVAGVSVPSRHFARNAGFLRPYFASPLGMSRSKATHSFSSLRMPSGSRSGTTAIESWLPSAASMSPRSVSRNRVGPAIAVGASAIVARQHTEIVSEAMREFGRPLHGGPAKVRMQVTVIRSMRMPVRCADVFEAKDDRRAPTPDPRRRMMTYEYNATLASIRTSSLADSTLWGSSQTSRFHAGPRRD